ncbi:hypothetical protein QBC34DRAFT_440523 [Podospora aff. communis PSN243]|uniref:Uncharacterized protein n=1 Tax=Podospora aff. communis PSN243 TaxID=3040156 RepID=A0AAV9GIF2_9PEZI|nr:hypothetical protein QBC34DRAFT_440523 [Podospora aff. communis PSN243]
MIIDTDRFKKVARSLRVFSRRRLLTSLHLAPRISEKYAIPISGHDKLHETFASDSLADNGFSCSFDTREEEVTSTMPEPTSPMTDTTNPTDPVSVNGNRSICHICWNFDSRAHRESKDSWHRTERRLARPAAGTTSILPLSLLWETEPQDGHGKPSYPGPNRTPSGHYPPSWSPASVSSPVSTQYNSEPSLRSTAGDTSATLCRVLDVSCELATSASLHDSDRSTLTVQGFVCELECRMDPSSDRSELVQHTPIHLREIQDDGISWSITMTHDVLPPRSIAMEWVNVKEKVIFLPILSCKGRKGEGDELVLKGLALRRVAGTSNVCTRIGTIKLRFWTSGGRRESWQNYLGRAATGGEEKIVRIL